MKVMGNTGLAGGATAVGLAMMAWAVAGCTGDTGPAGPAGTVGGSCMVTETATGDVMITCEDGTSVTVPAGSNCTVTEDPTTGASTISCEDGTSGTVTDGTTCTVTDNLDGTKTVACDDGTTVTIRDGVSAPNPAAGAGLIATVTVAPPATGSFYAVGEQIVVTVTLTDLLGEPLMLDDVDSARLYMTGPRRMAEAISAVGLLDAPIDRAVRPHHYIDFKTDPAPTALSVADNVLTYTLEAITDEATGTYQIGFYGRAGTASYDMRDDQVFEIVDVQIGTATVDEMIVGNCADCHEGSNGQIYLHHVDNGSTAIDAAPIRTCIMCHNQEGYAAFSGCSDGTRAPAGGCVAPLTTVRTPDPIIRRVHGVHMGIGLTSAFNVGPRGDFEDYEHVIFPAGRTNCQKCHLDDSWNTNPSRQACTACHDALDFTTGTYIPPRTRTGNLTGGRCAVAADCTGARFPYGTWTCNTTTALCEKATHTGGMAGDSACSGCHTPTGAGPSVTAVHAMPPPNFQFDIEATLSAPTSGTFYTTESPTLTITVRNAGTTTVVDPNTIVEPTFPRVNLFVSGPRNETEPVLTTAATGTAGIRAAARTGNQTYDLSGGGSLSLNIDGTAVSVPYVASAFATPSAATSTEVAAWLNANAAFAALATAVREYSSSTTSGYNRVAIQSNSRGSGSSVGVLAGALTTSLGLTVGTSVPVETHSYANNDLRVRLDPFNEDPRVTRSLTAITYQLDSVTGLEPGTYTVWIELGSAFPVSWTLVHFQVGVGGETCATTADCDGGLICEDSVCRETNIATNCVRCHEDTRMHAAYFGINFNPNICKSCHDYERQILGGVGWAGAGPNMGYGAAPIARRVHGVHRGHYLDKPEEIHASYDYSGVIFPQDIRNCQTCHSDNDNWREEPNRIACLACHDSDAALGHGQLMTVDPTQSEPYSGDEIETCATCHGDGRDFSVESVHNISDPFRAPYPR